MVDIQSLTAEIRRGKKGKKEERNHRAKIERPKKNKKKQSNEQVFMAEHKFQEMWWRNFAEITLEMWANAQRDNHPLANIGGTLCSMPQSG